MTISGSYFDLGDPIEISAAIVRNNGNEISFDFKSDSTLYTVILKREKGTLFQGEATSQPDGARADVTCRVYEDRNEGITVLVGSNWKYHSEQTNYKWMVELESGF